VSQAEPEAGPPVLMSDLVFAEIEATILSRPEAARAIDAIFLFVVKQEGQLAKRFGNTYIIFVHPVCFHSQIKYIYIYIIKYGTTCINPVNFLSYQPLSDHLDL
jgi:hypothetical protein